METVDTEVGRDSFHNELSGSKPVMDLGHRLCTSVLSVSSSAQQSMDSLGHKSWKPFVSFDHPTNLSLPRQCPALGKYWLLAFCAYAGLTRTHRAQKTKAAVHPSQSVPATLAGDEN